MKRFLFLVSAMLIAVGAWSQASITVTPLPEDTTGEDVTLSLNICNDESVKAFQCDLTLPESLTFNETDPVLTSRAQGFDIDFVRISGKQMRILVSSGSLSLIAPDSTAVVNFSVSVPSAEGVNNHVVKLTNAIVVLEDYDRVDLPDIDFPAFDIKPAFLVHYMSEGVEVYCDTVVQEKPVVAPSLVLEKEGHSFTGWEGLPSIMPGSDITVNAIFTRNSYSLIFKMDNDTITSSSVLYNDTIEVPAPPFKEGHTFIGWDSLVTVMPARDFVVNALYSRNSYALVYIVDGDTLSVSTMLYNDTIVPLEVPEVEGKTFSGWIDIPLTMPAHNLTVKGTFDVYSFKLSYIVDGKVVMTFSYIYGTELTLEDEPTKEGYTFSGWSELPEVMPAKNVEVTGSFTINNYKFTYIVDGEVYQTDSVTYGRPITPMSAPIKEGYTFSGWSSIPTTMPAHDVVVTGSFAINCYRIKYTLDGETYKTDSIVYGDTIFAEANPVKEGYTFSGWCEIPETMPAHDVNVVGSFTVNIYEVTYIITLDNEVYQTINQMLAYGTSIVLPQLPSFTGYTFNGWNDIPATMPAENVTFTASFTINNYLLTFIVKVDGEVQEVFTDSVKYAETIVAPDVSEMEGYTFSGWNNVLDRMPANDVTIQGEYTLNTTQTDDQGLIYSLNKQRDAFEVSDYTEDLRSEIVVPEQLFGLPVNAIQDRALTDALELNAITIPTSITTVGKRVFRGCDNLLVVEWNAEATLSSLPFGKMEDFVNMLIFTTSSNKIEGTVRNLIVDSVAEQIVLTDGYPFRNPRNFTAQNINFIREFTKKTRIGEVGGWEAMVLPFDVESVISETRGELKPFGLADFTISLPYWVAQLQADGSFVYIDSIKAHAPFIMEVPNSDEYEDRYNVVGQVTFSADSVTVYATTDMDREVEDDLVLLGSYEGISADRAVYALNDEEVYTDGNSYMEGSIFVADSRDIRPFEAYVYSNQVVPAPYLRIGENVGTGIDHSTFNIQHSTEIYDLMGRRILNIENLKSGVYIVNGKKVVIK